MNEPSSIRTNSLSSKSALPPFHIRGLEQILFHRDAFSHTQARPKSSHVLLQQRPQSSARPQTSHYRKSFPLSIEAGSSSNADNDTHEKRNSHGKLARRTSIGDRNVQVLRAINDVLVTQVDSLGRQLEETSHILRERQLDLAYISEIELLAKDEIAELRQQILEKEETIKAKDEAIRKREEIFGQKDELIRQKDAWISEQHQALIRKDDEIENAKKEIKKREKILDEMERESKAQTTISSKRTSISRFREENCLVFPDHLQTLDSELDLTTDKRPLSKRSSLTKGKHALREMLREHRETQSRKAAIKANIRASKVESRERERTAESSGTSEAQSTASEASRHPGLLNDENADPANDGGQTKSFVRLKSLVGGRRPKVHPQSKSHNLSVTGSEGSNS